MIDPHDHVLRDRDEGAAIREIVAENMRRIRLSRGMSLRDMAAATGLSKALMSQLEREVANPTISTLTQVAAALDISFAELTRATHLEPEILPPADQRDRRTGARMLFTMPERRRFDLSEGYIERDDHGVMSDHGTGSMEYAYVVDGEVDLVLGDRIFTLPARSTICFSAETPHRYQGRAVSSTVLSVVTYAD